MGFSLAAQGVLLALLLSSATTLPAPASLQSSDVTDLFHGAGLQKREARSICYYCDLPNPILLPEVKRDAVADEEKPPLLKLPIFNPLYPYGFIPPGKFGLPLSPLISPSDILLNRFAKNASAAASASAAAAPTPTDPLLIASYFKAKKDEFLSKLYDKITTAGMTDPSVVGGVKRQALIDDSATATKAPKPSSFFMGKKFDFLSKLLTTLNTTTPAPATDIVSEEDLDATTVTTPKPTIVPPGFWIAGFPLPKTPKPTKAPKPPKPPKPDKILKDVLDTMLLQSLLNELGGDPAGTGAARRAVVAPPTPPKKFKAAKKLKPVPEEITEYHIPSKVDPSFYETKASEYLDKLFKALNKTSDDDVTGAFVEPKATVIPLNFWTQPSQTEYTSKLDAFLDLLTKSLSVKPKSGPSRKKRASFLDEFLHRIPPSTPAPETEQEELDEDEESRKRSLLFRPFSPGIWMPSYLYASRMAAYMDALNSLGDTTDPMDSFGPLKRAVTPSDEAALPPKDAALNLIIAELTELKDSIVSAFAEGVKAQKDASVTTPKPYPAPAKPFKKPLWGPKPTPTATVDPVAPIQKRIDMLNDVFDKLVLMEKTLLGTSADATVAATEQSTLVTSSAADTTAKPTIVPPSFWLPDASGAGSPDYYVSKTQEFLQKLFDNKGQTTVSPDN